MKIFVDLLHLWLQSYLLPSHKNTARIFCEEANILFRKSLLEGKTSQENKNTQ